jgi:hypothetical protein
MPSLSERLYDSQQEGQLYFKDNYTSVDLQLVGTQNTAFRRASIQFNRYDVVVVVTCVTLSANTFAAVANTCDCAAGLPREDIKAGDKLRDSSSVG